MSDTTIFGRRGTELIASSKVPIVSMVVFRDRLFVATAEGVFERLEDGVFHECRLMRFGDQS